MSENTTYIIIGDVHEQLQALRELLKRAGYILENDIIEDRNDYKINEPGDKSIFPFGEK